MAAVSSTRTQASVHAKPRALAPSAQLVLAAATIAALFGALLVAPLPIWSAQPSRPATAGSSPAEPVGWIGLIIPAAFLLALWLPFRPYVHAQRLLARQPIRLPLLLGATALLALTALLIYPGYGSDIFDYLGFERMWAVYGDNPLLALPINRPGDWSTAYVWYPDRTPAYGPLWAVLTWPIASLAGESVTAVVAGYKVLSITAYAACCWLVWASVEPARRQRALVAFAWSPLVLFEVLGKVHNDILPALAMLLMIWLLSRPRIGALGLAAVVAGGLVKITALAAAPAAAVYLWRHGRWRPVLVAVSVAAVFAAACYAPFWQGLSTLAPIWNQTSRVVWSPASVLVVASGWLPGGPYDRPVRLLLGLIWLGLSAAALSRGRHSRPSEVAATSGWLLLISLLLLTSAVYAHYLVAAVALAAVSDDERLQRLALWSSIGGLGAYAVELLGLPLGPDFLGTDGYRVVGSLVLLAPPALALLPLRRAPRPALGTRAHPA